MLGRGGLIVVVGAGERIVTGGTGRARRAVKALDHLKRGAFDDRAHRELDGFERAFANARVEEVVARKSNTPA